MELVHGNKKTCFAALSIMQGEKTAIVLENILCVIFAASESWNV
jgi:hypothetical protein